MRKEFFFGRSLLLDQALLSTYYHFPGTIVSQDIKDFQNRKVPVG